MKQLLLAVGIIGVALSSFAQGTVVFNNRFTASTPPVDAPVYRDVVTGSLADRLEGTAWLAQLYGGAANQTEAQLVPVLGAAVPFRTGAAAGYVDVGTDNSRTIPGTVSGGSAVLQLRVWSAAAGATWEVAQAAAQTNPTYRTGKSNLITVSGLGGPVPSSPDAPPAPLVGLQSFAVVPVPEPASIAMGILGAGLLLALRRRK